MMKPDDPGLSAMMKRILEKRNEMLARIDENGVLTLTMGDIFKGISFEEAQAENVRGGMIPVHRARHIVLSHKGKVKFLKDRIPAGEICEGECEACGGDQYLQPCPVCGKE